MDCDSTPEFDGQFLKLTRKKKALEERLVKKIRWILDNPFTGDPKRHELKLACGSHVDPYAIIYIVSLRASSWVNSRLISARIKCVLNPWRQQCGAKCSSIRSEARLCK